MFAKTDNADIVVLTKDLAAGSYEFKLFDAGADKWYSRSNANFYAKKIYSRKSSKSPILSGFFPFQSRDIFVPKRR